MALKKTSTANLFGAFQLPVTDVSNRRTDLFDAAMRFKLAPHNPSNQCDGMCQQTPFVILPLCPALLEETEEGGSSCECGSSSTVRERRRAILSWREDLPSNQDLEHAAASCSLSGKNQFATDPPADVDEETGEGFGVERQTETKRGVARDRVAGHTSCLNEEHDCYDSEVEPFRHCEFHHVRRRPYTDDEPESDDHYNSHSDGKPRYHGYRALPTAECHRCDVWQANTAKYGQQEDLVVPQPRSLESTREARDLLNYRAPSTRIIKSTNPFNPFVRRMLESQNEVIPPESGLHSKPTVQGPSYGRPFG
ncbi:hypothetical protein E1B28_011853 [Marasmius oreades]|uniref:Uncharacterized protein n=1 Tax=Marasmius oreades TaxID=181124 RepID=A0A9P7URM7_9AGAR|nr:uncharacterized protein E1B28_011853 [Marasmius oreades]KAG7090256.1 hypothetical protein E1B28_011853 [Marasmius oreades]